MDAKKKSEAKIERNIDGFLNSKLGELDQKPTLRELTLLRVLIQIVNGYKLETFISRDKTYFWIAKSVILKKLENIHYTEKMLRMDISALDSLDLISRYVESTGKSKRVFYCITKLTRELFIFDIK